jgi:2-oxo-4-hydroxy-4-carboxy-5-ureidoimidazoline decarboxylase
MSGATRIELSRLNSAEPAEFMAGLGDLYEHAPWVARAAMARRPFASLDALQESMKSVVQRASPDERVALIRGHPELAVRAAENAKLSDDSQKEQASAGLDHLSSEDLARFQQLNAAYRQKFDMPFIICVRRHTKDSILRQFERRLQNTRAAEIEAALDEIFRIVALRLDQRIAAPDRLSVHGHLSTHVLDIHSGHPAEGMTIELLELAENGSGQPIVKDVTNRDGRTSEPLIAGRPLPIGRYELRFHVAAYFARLEARQSNPAFLDIVPVRFAIAEPEGVYHVPLLVTPWSYSTYRGS